MSRVGKKVIDIPSDATVTFDGNHVTVKGPKGELSRTSNERMTFEQEGNTVEVVRPSDFKEDRINRGTTRALLNNMVQGVSQGYVKVFELVGVGYHAQMQGRDLILNVGYFHPIEIKAEENTTLSVEKNIVVKVEGISKEQVGALTFNTRLARPPEPYKGKGIRYQDEYVRRKEDKTGKQQINPKERSIEMISKIDKDKVRLRKHTRVRTNLSGTAEKPRLSVYRPNKYIYTQIIDDSKDVTSAQASSKDSNIAITATKVELAVKVGETIAKKATDKGIKEIVFDCGGYLYHGRVKALAEVARESGLKF